jgi:L-alanine-DL-glutamate epimerase-like enolase superfamily enzyme
VSASRDIEFVRTVRSAIGDAGFIVDIGAKVHWNVPYAIRMAEAFAPYNLTWLEDVFPPEHMEGYTHLRQAVPGMMIGFGERFWNRTDYLRLLQADVCDVILVDPGRTEGITGMQQITQLAARYHVGMDPHCWSSAIITAASLHVAFASTNATIFEMKPFENPMQHELVTEPFHPVDGYMFVPDKPGLGVEVIEKTVEKYNLKRA